MSLSLSLGLMLGSAAASGTAPPAAQDPMALEIFGADVTAAGQSITADSCIAVLTFMGMGLRAPVVTAGSPDVYSCPEGLDATKITILVSDPGYDATGAAATRYRVIKGRKSLRNPWPAKVAAGTYAAGSFAHNGTANVNSYYTAAGGSTQSATLPSHTSGTATTAGSNVAWTYVGATIPNGYVQTLVGSDCKRWFVLDGPIYAGTTILSVSVGSGAYNDGTLTSNARTMIVGSEVTNGSTLAYEIPIVMPVSLPHQRSTGSLTVEFHADHAWAQAGRQVACVKARAWDATRSSSSSLVTVSDPSLSTLYTTSGPGGVATEVYSATLDTSGLAAGDSFVEYQVYPWLGTRIFDSRYDGEASNWQASTAYSRVAVASGPAGEVHRNGANFYILTTAGTSASSGGPTGTGTAIADGTCVWDYWGADATSHNSRNPPARFHFYNDPSSVYKVGYCFVDASAGGGAGVVYSSYAAAYAAKGTVTNCYPGIQQAAAALKTYHNTAGGGLTTHDDAGGGHIYCKAGTYSGFAASMATITKGSEWMHVHVDPDASGGTVIVATGGTSKVPMRRMYYHSGFTFTASGTSALNYFIDHGATDGTSTPGQPVSELVIEGITATQYDATQQSMFQRIGLSWVINSTINSYALYGNENTRAHTVLFAGNLVDCLSTGSASVKAGTMVANTIKGRNATTDPRSTGQPYPMFWIGADNKWVSGAAGGSGACMVDVFKGTAADRTFAALGGSFIGNLIAITDNGASGNKAAQIAADGSELANRNILVMANTHVGDRTNIGYNDAVAAVRSQYFIRHNIFRTMNVVGDSQAHAGNSKDGSKVDNWWPRHGVAAPRNVVFLGAEGGTVPDPSIGIEAVDPTTKFAEVAQVDIKTEFVNDKSTDGTTPGDGGDYHPVYADSTCVDMVVADAYGVQTQVRKYALDGAVRELDGTGAVGAYEYA